MRGTARLVTTGLAILAALLLQVTVLPRMGWPDAGVGVVPGVVLLVVIGTALSTDVAFATVAGFAAGLLLDLAPPADHIAGRWALALLVVGYVVGRFSHDHATDHPGEDGLHRARIGLCVAAVLGGSFVANSVFALSGLLLQDPLTPFGDLMRVVLGSLGLDLLAAVVVLPALFALFRGVARWRTPEAGRVSPRTGVARRMVP